MTGHTVALQCAISALNRIAKICARRQHDREYLLQIEERIYPLGTVKTPGQISESCAQRIVDHMGISAGQGLCAVANPGRNTQRNAVHAVPRIEQFLRALQPALRQFLRAIHGDLTQSMLQAVVGKARTLVAAITGHVDLRRHIQSRRGLLGHIALDKPQQMRIADCLEYRLVPRKQANIGQQ